MRRDRERPAARRVFLYLFEHRLIEEVDNRFFDCRSSSLDNVLEANGQGVELCQTLRNVMAVCLVGNKLVERASAEFCDRFGKLGAGFDVVKGTIHVFAEFRPMCSRGNEHGVLAAQTLGNLVGNGGVRVDEIVMLAENLFNGFKASFAVDGVGFEISLKLCKRFAVDGEGFVLLQLIHPGCNGLRVATSELEELAFHIRGNQDVHRRRWREDELAVGDVIAAGVDEVGQHAVFVACAEQRAKRSADLLGVPCCQDIAEIAGGNANVERLACFKLALRDQFSIA